MTGANLVRNPVFFLTIEKRRATQNTVRKVLSNEQEITDSSKINTHIYQFYQQLYMEKQNISEDSICNFLNDITVPSLTTELSLPCEGNLTVKEIYNSLITFELSHLVMMGSQKNFTIPFGMTLKVH